MMRRDVNLFTTAVFPGSLYSRDEATDELFIEGKVSVNSSVKRAWPSLKNPIDELPFDVRESLLTDCYDTGSISLAQKYFESMALRRDMSWRLADLVQGIFTYATRRQKHQLAYNIVIVLSQLPYDYLGDWACLMAVAATRSSYLDVTEMGIRCFENWEDKAACEFLEGCSFSETWLQEYADEVCAYVMSATVEEGGKRVLFEKDFTRQVARRDGNSTSYSEGRASRHSSIGTEDREQQAFSLAS